MEYRTRGGDKVSLLGFGCMLLHKLDTDKQDIEYGQVQAMVYYAYAHGLNYFDTAFPYHMGKSEAFIGEALKKYPRDSFFLADKMPGWMLKTREDGPKLFEKQLQRCQVEFFDYYLCHAIGQSDTDFTVPYEQTGVFDYLQDQKAAGRIRRLGFSFHGTPERLEMLLPRYDWDFVQIQLNYLDWDLQQAKTLYDMLAVRNIPCTVMEPVRGGSLHSLCDQAVNILKADQPDHSPASWAIRFAASLPNVLTVLSGMSTPEHVRDNIATMTHFQPLTAHEHEVLHQALEAYRATGAIPCTACGYCMDCPSGVDIPEVFATYNRSATSLGLAVFVPLLHHTNRHARTFAEAYSALPESARAHNCTSCGHCMEHCPQHIDIAERMQFIAGLAKELQA